MDLNKIKNLVKQNGDKFVFVENGEPEAVMMSFGEYEKLLTGGRYEPRALEHHSRGNYGVELADWGLGETIGTEFIAPVEVGEAGLPVRLEDIRLEDLPI